MSKHEITLTVNEQRYRLKVGDSAEEVKPSDTLSHTLRETLGLTGTKVGCNKGECGSCTVLMENKPVLSCMTLTIECDGKSITTIEGLEDKATGKPDPVQESFVENGAFQCGFCTPGIIMSTKALLNEKPSASEEDVKEALSGHYCRCISHYHVVDAVHKCVNKCANEGR